MFGIRYLKASPNVYVMHHKGGRVVREGEGLSFFYFSLASSVVAVPLSSADVPFIFEEVTADFQELTVQGQVTYRVREPAKLARLLDYTLAANHRDYVSEDPDRLPERVINLIQVLMRDEVQRRPLREALRSSEAMVAGVRKNLVSAEMVRELGLEILALSVLAVKPNPETARALEAEVREQLLLESDEAIYTRRNAAVEQERAIRENELKTEIAVEHKKREIREAKVDADRAVMLKRASMRQEEMGAEVELEERRSDLVALAVKNSKEEADAKAYGMDAVLGAFKSVDPKVMQSLANAGMNPAQMIAAAFQNLADNAGKIGNLNISPELLQEILAASPAKRAS